MTTVTIDNRSYPCPSAWNEIGWEQFFTLAEYAGQTVGTSATERKAERVLERICGVDPGTVRKIDGRQRKQFADCLGERFFGFPPPFPENPDGNGSTDGFDWNGIRMLFPAPAVDPDGSVVPLAHTTAVELCEATDLYLCDKWRYAPLVVAILCRPEGEPYREQTCRHRAWSMKKLPMDIVLRLYDMLRQAHRYLKRNYPLCYETPRTNGEKPGREGPTWNELLLWAGHFRIDEIEPVRRMNCHDFMDLVQSRIKMNG